ncbi:FliH/SctL family protein [Salinisphaera sp. RV14]|uniref:FliH/SctL family protein n=1 Tax=unclassified Salinisphaera TaxID=2649847 RepID=UPI003F827D75
MADRNIKPVERVARNVPLKIGGDRRPSVNLDSSEHEVTEHTPDPAPSDRMARQRPTPDPHTYAPVEPRIATEHRPAEAPAADPSAEAIEAGRREGHEQGRTVGYAAGYEEGLAAGRADGRAEREAEQAQLRAILEALHHPLDTLRAEIADSISEGALRLAQRLVGEALTIDPTLMRDTLNNILGEAAAHNGPGARLQLRVAPDDREVTERLINNRRASDLPVDLINDDKLAHGDVQATLVHDNGDPANQVEWDARLETRWQTIKQALSNPQS